MQTASQSTRCSLIPNGNAVTVDIHIFAASPCVGAGLPIAGITNDFDGDARLNPPAIGADQPTRSSNANAYSYGYSDSYLNATASPTGTPPATPTAYSHVYTYTYGDCYVYANAYSHGNIHANTDAYSNTNADLRPCRLAIGSAPASGTLCDPGCARYRQ